jgi:hypothetical protein
MFVRNVNDYGHLHVRSDLVLDPEVDKTEPWKTSFARKRERKAAVALNLYPTRETTRTKCITSRPMLPNLDINITRRWIE